ncbi:MAG TPA: hypothetical protein VGQ39_10365 [Pyrinomonadaceae bacterium]|nr:hypothetical protein [Pyrinomonadaceae bacterium]
MINNAFFSVATHTWGMEISQGFTTGKFGMAFDCALNPSNGMIEEAPESLNALLETMSKLSCTLGSLLTIFAVTVSDYAGDQVATTNHDLVGRARDSYYSLPKKGFKGFTATVEPNWKIILADTATRENLKVFRAVKFSIVVAADGVATVHYRVDANAAKPELQPFVNRIHYDLERLVAGFFNTWRLFMVGSPFPEMERPIKIENPGDQYRLFYTLQSGALMIMMTDDFLITEWNLSGPTAKRTIKPHFQKTIDGHLLTDYQSVFEPTGDGIKTTLDFNIEYRNVSGMKLPHKVRLKGMHGDESIESELVFRVNGSN